MSPVIVVFVVWFALVAVIDAVIIARAERWRAPAWAGKARRRWATAVDDVMPTLTRGVTAAIALLAMWSVVIIVGLVMGIIAHRLQGPIDEPGFRWWNSHHLGGAWHDVWWKLTNIGMPGSPRASPRPRRSCSRCSTASVRTGGRPASR